MRKFLYNLIQWIKRFVKETLHWRNENISYYITIALAAILFMGALKIFIEFTDELAENELGYFDDLVSGAIISFRSLPLTAFFLFMTDMGDKVAYLVITVAIGVYFLLRHRSWKFIFQIVLVLGLSTLSNVAIKKVINRARPSGEHLVHVDTLSFPSGHSMSAMAFYGFLIYLVLQSGLNRFITSMIITFLLLIILSVGVSRIYLGVHFPSDVVAGYMGGLIWVTFCVIIFNVIDLRRLSKRRDLKGR